MEAFFFEDRGLFGLKNKSGQILVNPLYIAVREFRNGFAAVCLLGGKRGSFSLNYERWSFIDESGKKIHERHFDLVSDFQSNCAIVEGDYSSDLLDRNGKLFFYNVIKPDNSKVGSHNIHSLGFGTYLLTYDTRNGVLSSSTRTHYIIIDTTTGYGIYDWQIHDLDKLGSRDHNNSGELYIVKFGNLLNSLKRYLWNTITIDTLKVKLERWVDVADDSNDIWSW